MDDGNWLRADGDEAYLLGLAADALGPGWLSVRDVAAAGRAAFTWLRVDSDIHNCLSEAWERRRSQVPAPR